ncbi:MerR family transcriptional regulator [Corynebacterium sp.]|uniref:transcriptional regulator FtsR n=2 Tax=Corynebacterium TaxID=1716 RepID=UPI0035A0F3A9
MSASKSTAAATSPSSVKATTPKARPAKQKPMSIGVMLKQLQPQFPDVTVSKIRFLEAEGLITPERTAKGYRRFYQKDVDRLRYILTAQRDHYTPLKVIREQLEAMDSGQVTAIVSAQNEALVSAEQLRAPVVSRLTDADVADQAGATQEDIADLVKVGLITPDAAGFFDTDDVSIVSAAVALKSFGFEARQLKSLRNAARRQADLISQVAAPVAHSKSDTAPQQAEELSQQLAALVLSLHGTLVKTELRDEFQG